MSSQSEPHVEAREQLLVTASRLMREDSTIQVSLSELSKAANLNSALVKYYFGNKSGLMREVLLRDMEGIKRAFEELVESDADLETKFQRHIGGVVDTIYRVPYIQELMIEVLRQSTPSEAQRLADRFLKPIFATYERLICQGVEQGIFRAVDPQMFFFTLIGSADRFFAARAFFRYGYGEDSLTEELRDRYRAHAVDFVMAGLLKK